MTMAEENSDLFSAFAEDHAFLGKGFFELSSALRAKDLDAARRAAERLDQEAGAHIAFEEEHFYPRLAGLLGERTIEGMLAEHREGLQVIDQLCTPSTGTAPSDRSWQTLLAKSEHMERHIAECGELFEAIGRLPPSEQEYLHDKLIEWRLKRPGWRRYALATMTRHASALTS